MSRINVESLIKSLINPKAVDKRRKELGHMQKYGLGFLTVTKASKQSIDLLNDKLENQTAQIIERASDIAYMYGRTTLEPFDIEEAMRLIKKENN